MGQQLTAEAVERRPHSLPALDAGRQLAGQGQHLLARARAEIIVGGADHPVGAAQCLAQCGSQRAAAALELRLRVMPVVGGQAGGDLA